MEKLIECSDCGCIYSKDIYEYCPSCEYDIKEEFIYK